MNLVPSWVYWIVIGALTLAVVGEETRIAYTKLELSEERTMRSNENQERLTLALTYQTKVGKLEREHAATIQAKDEKYAKDTLALKTSRDLNAADAKRLSGKLANYTSGANATGETDAAFCQRARDRLPLIGRLLGQGQELLDEAQGIIQQRAVDIGRLKDQIDADRKACTE